MTSHENDRGAGLASGQAAAVILAAGHGKRMRSNLLKVLHPVAGRPMVEHVVRAVRAAGISRIVLVVGHQAERVKAHFGDTVEYAEQHEQLGTGHATLQARAALANFSGDIVVITGDSTLLTPQAVSGLLETHRREQAAATLLTAVVPDPGSFGRIVRDAAGRYVRTVEARDASPEQLAIREVMSGTFCFRADTLWDKLNALRPDNEQGEYYLTDVPGMIVGEGGVVAVSVAEDWRTVLGPNDRRELAEAEAVLRQRVLDRLALSGVTIVDPQTTYVHDTVEVGQDTVIEPFTFLQGHTVIGSGCTIGPQARVIDSRIGDGVTVDASVVEASEVGNGSRIGPFAHLRPGTVVGEQCEIGNYAELKQAVLGPRVKAHHHTYLGNVTLGAGTNVGAGVVVVNYDGKRKHETAVGDGAFLGCNVNLVAPLTIGDGAFVAAGSTVNEDVPAGALAIARTRQETKPGYAARLLGRRAGAGAGSGSRAGPDAARSDDPSAHEGGTTKQ